MVESYIEHSGGVRIPLLGVGITYSTGDSLELSQRYSHDATDTSQSITRRVRNTALTATLSLALTPYTTAQEDILITDYIAWLEDLCGKRVSLVFNGVPQPEFVVQSVSISCEADSITVFGSVSISISLTEGRVAHKTLYTAVKTL